MTRLLFTADGLLREQTRGAESRVLSRVTEDRDGARTRLVSGEAEHEIVPFAQTGWALELRDGDGGRSGGFQPFRLRRGGRLRVGEVGMSLHGRPWSHDGWVFSLPDGRRVEATVTVAGEDASSGDGAGDGGPRLRACVVVLEVVESLELLTLVDVLALGCWLIARWHRTPVVDHLLTSAVAGTGLAAGSGKPASAGIRAQTAN